MERSNGSYFGGARAAFLPATLSIIVVWDAVAATLHDGNPIFLPPPPPHAAATRTHASNAHAMVVYYEIIGPDAAPPFARAFNIKEIELDESRWLSIHVMIISLPEIHPPNCTRAP